MILGNIFSCYCRLSSSWLHWTGFSMNTAWQVWTAQNRLIFVHFPFVTSIPKWICLLCIPIGLGGSNPKIARTGEVCCIYSDRL